MANETRNTQKNSGSHQLSIESFANDVFSFILAKFDFPETSILSADIEGNMYSSKAFVKNAGLSVLSLSMFMRDGWKTMFEFRHSRTGFSSLKMIQGYLKDVLIRNSDFQNADEATKVRVSLALFTEIILFFKYKGLETHAESLSKYWGDIYLEYIARNQDIEKLFASSFLMFSGASESTEWIITFVEKYAVPYGRLNNVSEIFSAYSILSEHSKTSPLKKKLKHNVIQCCTDKPAKFVAGTPEVPGEKSVPFPGDSQSASPATMIDLKMHDHQPNRRSEEKLTIERISCGKQSTSDFVLNNMTQQKLSVSEIEEAVGQMSIDGVNISQECDSVKQKRKKGGKNGN